VAYLVIEETNTDENGYYYFDSWGPKLTFRGDIDSAPSILFYKHGYKHNGAGTKLWPGYSVPWVIYSETTGKAHTLERFEGTVKEYEKIVGRLDFILMLKSNHDGFECAWEDVPKYTAAMIKLKKYFDKNNVYTRLYDIENELRDGDCSDPDEILRGYLQ